MGPDEGRTIVSLQDHRTLDSVIAIDRIYVGRVFI